MPVGGALAIAGAGLASGAMSANAQKKAGQTVANSTDRAADLQNQQFQQLLALQMPGYRRAEGASAIYAQALGLSGMPGYSQQVQPAPAQYQMTGGQMTGGGYRYPSGGAQQQFAALVDDGSYGDFGLSPQMRLMTGGGSYTNGSAKVPAPQLMPEDPNAPQINPGPTGNLPGAPGSGADIASIVKATPGYQAQLDQGLKAIDRAAPLTGGMYSGRRMKALETHGQNTFGGYYQDWLNRVGGMAGQAQTISQNIGQAGMQNASNVGGLMVQGANARAQGMTNSANAWGGAIGDAVGAGMMLGGQAGWFRK